MRSISVLLLVFSVFASAAEHTDDLMEIVVTAGRIDHPAARLPANYRVISRQEISDSGASSVSDILQTAAGVQVADQFGDGSRAAVSMRGFGSNAHSNTLILLNGRKLNNALDIAPAQLTSLQLEEIERIEIVHGSAGVLYGENAVGGVINIVTRPIRNELLEVSVETGSYDREAGAVRLHRRLQPGLRLRLHASSLDTDNYRVRNRRKDSQFGGGLDFETGAHRLYAEWNRQDEDLQLPGALFVARRDQDRRQPDNYISHVDTDSDSARAGWHYAPASGLLTEVDFTWRDDDASGQLNFGGPCSFTQARTQWAFAPRMSVELPTENGKGLFTAGWDRELADYQISTACIGDQFAEQEMDALYLQLQWPLTSQLDLVTGLRKVWVQTHLRDTSVAGPAFAIFPARTRFSDEGDVHDLGIEYHPSEEERFYLRRAENFRFGKVDEHTNQFGVANVQPLRTQTGSSWEGGMQLRKSWGQLGLSAYRLHLKNEIAYDSIRFINRNLEPTSRIGWQLDYDRPLTSRIDVRLSQAYVNARFRSGANEGQRIPFVAQRHFTVGLTGRITARLRSGLEYQRISDRNPASDDANQFAEIKGHERTDLFLNWEHKQVEVNFRLNNALNEDYDSFGTAAFNLATFATETAFYPAPERNLAIRFSWRM